MNHFHFHQKNEVKVYITDNVLICNLTSKRLWYHSNFAGQSQIDKASLARVSQLPGGPWLLIKKSNSFVTLQSLLEILTSDYVLMNVEQVMKV